MILVSSSTLQYNKITVAFDSSKSLTIFNNGVAATNVSISSDTSCFVPNILNVNIPMNGNVTVNIKFTPTAAQVYSGNLTIADNATTSIVTLNGEGIIPSAVISLNTLDFQKIAIFDTKDLILNIKNISIEAILKIDSIVSNNIKFVSDTGAILIQAGSSKDVKISCESNIVEVLSGILTIVSNSNTPSIQVPLAANIVTPTAITDRTSVSFGSVTVNETIIEKVVLTNTSTDLNVIVQNIFSSNPIFITQNSNIVLSPSSSVSLDISFKPVDTSVQSGNVVITTNAGIFTIPVSGTGIQSANISLSTTEINFGNVAINTSLNKTLRISNTGLVQPLNVIFISSSNVKFSVNPQSCIIPAGLFYDVNVTFSPDIAQSESANILIKSDDANTPEVNVNVVGIGVSAKIEVDNTLDFSFVGIGDNLQKQLQIINSGSVPLIISQLAFTNTQFSAVTSLPLVIDDNSSNNLLLKFTPNIIGFSSSQMTITSNDILAPVKVVTLTSIGAEANIEISPNVLAFETIALNTKATLPETVHNTGTTNLEITEVKINGSSVDVTNPSKKFYVDKTAFTVMPAVSSILNVSFNGLETGQKQTCVITLVTNDPDMSNITFTVIGSVDQPVMIVSTSSLIFNAVVGEEVEQYFEILNVSSGGWFGKNQSVQLNITQSTTPVEFTANDLTIAPNSKANFYVKFKTNVAIEQDISGTLILNSNAAEPSTVTISLLAHVRKEPRIKTDKNGLAFTPVSVGERSSAVLIVENVGTANLEYSASLGFIEQNFIIDSSDSGTIEPGKTSVIKVTFNPQSIGAQNGNMEITSNDPTHDSLLIPLTGTAEVPVLKWQSKTLALPKEIAAAAEAISSVLDIILVVLEVMQTLLTTIKAFILDISNPLVAIIKGIQLLITNFINDFAATGVYVLKILPNDSRQNAVNFPELYADIPGIDKLPKGLLTSTLDYFNSVKGGSKAFFNKIMLSFDDVGDRYRPQFSTSAQAGAIIIAIDTGEIAKLVKLIIAITRLFKIEFKAMWQPPANLSAVAGNAAVRLMFECGGGLLPDGYLIFRSDKSGGEFQEDPYKDAAGKEYKKIRTDEYGRPVKKYKYYGYVTMNEVVMKAFNCSSTKATAILVAAFNTNAGLLTLLRQTFALQIQYDDTGLVNGQTYYYVVASASFDTTKIKSIAKGSIESIDLITTVGVDNVGNIKKYAGKPSSDTAIDAVSEFSSEISMAPNSTNFPSLDTVVETFGDGMKMCRNFKCNKTQSNTETVKVNDFVVLLRTGIKLAKQNPDINTLKILWFEDETSVGESIESSLYTFLNNTINFQKAFMTNGSYFVISYDYKELSMTADDSTKNVITLSPGQIQEESLPISLSRKNVIGTSIKIASSLVRIYYTKPDNSTGFEWLNMDGKVDQKSINESNGSFAMSYNYETLRKQAELFGIYTFQTVKVISTFQYKSTDATNYACQNQEYAVYNFKAPKCYNGHTMCKGYQNANCTWNTGTKCTNPGISTVKQSEVFTNLLTGAVSMFVTPQDVPYKDFFYIPQKCQNGESAVVCGGYSITPPRAGYKGTPPDWSSITLGELFPSIYDLATFINKYLDKLLAGIASAGKAIIDFIDLIQQKIADLQAFIAKIKSYLDILKGDFNIGKVSLLNIPLAPGGTEYLKQAIQSATDGPSSDASGYTAGIVLAYGGPNAVAAANIFSSIFG